MRIRKSDLVFVLVAFLAIICIASGTAHASPGDPHYTDGTTCQGPLCPGGPPPLAPAWAGEPCHSNLVVDPPSFVWITEHASTAYPTDGTEFDDRVVNYHGSAPGTFQVDGTWLAGRKGFLALTWNIGLGESAPLAFDCTTPPSSSTTSSTSTTSTTAPATTSTTAPPASSSTTIQIGTPITAKTPPPAPASLPFTGGDTAPLAFAGVACCTLGAILTRRGGGR